MTIFPSAGPVQPTTLTVEQAATVLGVARSTAYELVRAGDIDSVRLRRRIVVPVAHLADRLGVHRRRHLDGSAVRSVRVGPLIWRVAPVQHSAESVAFHISRHRERKTIEGLGRVPGRGRRSPVYRALMPVSDPSWQERRLVMSAAALLGEARPIIEHNLAGLTDAEYLWEPTENCWSVRRREYIRSPGCWGRGDWVVEVSPDGTSEPAMTTIAWRLMHAYDCATDFASRALGGDGHDWDDIEVPGEATTAVEMMLAGLDEIAIALRDAQDEVLNAADDPAFHRPRWELLMKALQEPIHHCAEIGVLRAVWRSAR